MNKVIITIFITLIIGIIIYSLKDKYTQKIKTNQNELELTYKINAGIPFKWQYIIEDESIVEFVKNYVIKDENKGGIVGANIYTNYVFKGLKEGTTTITFQYVNFTDNNRVHEEKKHIVKVDSNLHISLVEE